MFRALWESWLLFCPFLFSFSFIAQFKACKIWPNSYIVFAGLWFFDADKNDWKIKSDIIMGTMLEVSKRGGLRKCSASRGQRQVFGDVRECRQKWQPPIAVPATYKAYPQAAVGSHCLWFIDDQLEWLWYLPLLLKTNPLSLAPGYGQICFNNILGMMRFGCDVNKTETIFAFGELECPVKNKTWCVRGFVLQF